MGMASCKLCKFFSPEETDPRGGWCRRYPPQVYFDADTDQECFTVPLVANDHWCGEFKKAPSLKNETLPVSAEFPLKDRVVVEFLTQAKVKPNTVALWLKTYNQDEEWVTREILKAIAWLQANPTKKPRSNFARFLGSWLSRAFEWHRKGLKGNKPPTDYEELLK